jgi:hypothetical protein
VSPTDGFERHTRHAPPRFWPLEDEEGRDASDSLMSPRRLVARPARYAMQLPRPPASAEEAADGRVGVARYHGVVVELEYSATPRTSGLCRLVTVLLRVALRRRVEAAIVELVEIPCGPLRIAVWKKADWVGHPDGTPSVGDQVLVTSWWTKEAGVASMRVVVEWTPYVAPRLSAELRRRLAKEQ